LPNTAWQPSQALTSQPLPIAGDPLSQPFPASPRHGYGHYLNNSHNLHDDGHAHGHVNYSRAADSKRTQPSSTFPSYSELSRSSSSPAMIPSYNDTSSATWLAKRVGAASSSTELVLDDEQQRKSKRIMKTAMRLFQDTVDVLSPSLLMLYSHIIDHLSCDYVVCGRYWRVKPNQWNRYIQHLLMCYHKVSDLMVLIY
jgi:hypothetical protein